MMNDTETTPESNDQIGKGLSKWASGYDNLKIQDWLIMSGVHKETGIVLDLPIHNL